MDARTAAVYAKHARTWISERAVKLAARRRIAALARALGRSARVADLGCGPGWHAAVLRRAGLSVVALDVTRAMLEEARVRARGVPLVRGDLAHLPFAREALDGAWAQNTYIHVPVHELPLALAELHRVLRPGARIALTLVDRASLRRPSRARGDGLVAQRQRDPIYGGRLFVADDAEGWHAHLAGAGFRAIRIAPGDGPFWFAVDAQRARTLPDSIRPDLRVLVCGLNPSLVAADTGVPFVGATNRFWPAALRSGLVARDRDVRDALAHGIGFTDLVKRATPASSAITRAEYTRGAERVARLVRTWQPRAVLFVGLEGYRRAIDPDATPGRLRAGFAGRSAYLMPSSSGRNAASSLDALVSHLRRVAKLTRDATSG
jgi:TDG/mug DNA glycosylase family protein